MVSPDLEERHRVYRAWHMIHGRLDRYNIIGFGDGYPANSRQEGERMEFKDPKDFREPIIRILRDLGGKARVKEIYEQFAARHPDVVQDPYWNASVDNDLRWRDSINRCRFQTLIPQGLLRRDSKRGTWELT